MRKYTTAILTIAVLLALNISCSEEVKPTPFVYTKVFTGEKSKTWKVKFMEQTLNGDIDDTFTVTCGSDDAYIFYANVERSLEIDMGSKKCEADEPNKIIDTWGFNNGTATMLMIVPFLSDTSLPFIVREAEKNKMVFEIFFDPSNTESYRIHFESTDEE